MKDLDEKCRFAYASKSLDIFLGSSDSDVTCWEVILDVLKSNSRLEEAGLLDALIFQVLL